MKSKEYQKTWLVFVNIKPEKGLLFNDLVDINENVDQAKEKYSGAWANVLIKANNITLALEIVPLGLLELGFVVEAIDKIENIGSLIENEALTKEVISEVDWLLASDFVFKISDRLFPYE